LVITFGRTGETLEGRTFSFKKLPSLIILFPYFPFFFSEAANTITIILKRGFFPFFYASKKKGANNNIRCAEKKTFHTILLFIEEMTKKKGVI
jgi:hypothetical protein